MNYTILTLCGALLLFTSVQAYADEYRLTIAREAVNITDKTVEKITINGGIPGPTLRFKEGEDVTIHVTNKMDEDTSVHWHGLLLPGEMDGLALTVFPALNQKKHLPIILKPVKAAPTGITHTVWGKNRMGIMALS